MIKEINNSEFARDIIFKTEQLYINKLTDLDLMYFHDMQSNAEVMQYIKPVMSLEESKRELNRFMSYYDRCDINFKIWAVRELVNDKMVGVCGVYSNENNDYEIAYRLRKKYWRKGYGKQICSSLIDYCFNVLEYPVIVATIDLKNLSSIKLIENYIYRYPHRYEKELQGKDLIYRIYNNSL